MQFKRITDVTSGKEAIVVSDIEETIEMSLSLITSSPFIRRHGEELTITADNATLFYRIDGITDGIAHCTLFRHGVYQHRSNFETRG